MGTGIMAAIPLVFKAHERFGIDAKNFTTGFFDNYNVEEIDGKKIYTIKEDLLIDNYRPFLVEFYDFIEEDIQKATKLAPDAIPDTGSLEEFMEVFEGRNRNNRVPFTYPTPMMFSTLGCVCEEYWLFYSGSYKAYLEVYSTLQHFERILAKAMKNPLANAIKFGIFG